MGEISCIARHDDPRTCENSGLRKHCVLEIMHPRGKGAFKNGSVHEGDLEDRQEPADGFSGLVAGKRV